MKPRNPFPGIRPFREDEGEFFFGRDHQLSELLAKLGLGSFVAVVGTSGCGKSSLIKAGLVPRLSRENWLVPVFRPQNPLENLRIALESIPFEFGDHEARAEFREIWMEMIPDNLLSSSNGIVETYKQSGSQKKLIIIIDQFEELFAYQKKSNDNRENAIRFINLLIQAVQQKVYPIHVLITLRSDQLGRCSEFKGLPEIINDGLFLVPRLSREQYREAIVRPLHVQNIKIASNLVSQLLNDIEDDPDQLPVLQHSLMVTFDKWIEKTKGPDFTIELNDYLAAGGMTQSIDAHCNSIFQKLKDKNLGLPIEVIFQRLTEINLEGVETRCPTTLIDLVELTGLEQDRLIEILDAFRQEGCNFLMPSMDTHPGKYDLIDLSHECIMRKWKMLNGWILKEEENKRFLQRLLEHFKNYTLGERGPLKNPTLSAYKSWEKFLNRDKSKVVRWAARYTNHFKHATDFIKTSIRWDNQRKRIQVLLLIAVPIVLVVGSLYATEKIQESKRERELKEFELNKVRLEKNNADLDRLNQLKKAENDSLNAQGLLIKQRTELKERIAYVEALLSTATTNLGKEQETVKMLNNKLTAKSTEVDELKKEKNILMSTLANSRKESSDSLTSDPFIQEFYFSQLKDELKNNQELLATFEKKVFEAQSKDLIDDQSSRLIINYIHELKTTIADISDGTKDKQIIEVFVQNINGGRASEFIAYLKAKGYGKDKEFIQHPQSDKTNYRKAGIFVVSENDNLFNQLKATLKGSKYENLLNKPDRKWHSYSAKKGQGIIVLDFDK